jgi:hypothetical protein
VLVVTAWNVTLASALRIRDLGRPGDEVPSSGFDAECFDAEYWLGRAEEVRRHATTMIDPRVRREMFLIAAGYELLARHAVSAGAKIPQ